MSDLAPAGRADKGSEIAQWLEAREPADVLADLRRFALRRPLMFLALCGLEAWWPAGSPAEQWRRTRALTRKPAPARRGEDDHYLATHWLQPGPATLEVYEQPGPP